MKTKIIFATGNANKMREIREILGEDSYDIQSMKEAGIDCDIVEDGATFEENSLIKARAISEYAKDAI
ncbi:non-canonical purine NTP pyrophosphatase, partial [Pseudobutyrivibrio sp.]|uniref:non-canonical purine NTP pyrophosphatase n=1 Tax=Pseudobutyrivibrio sp. TaxID=2014367 RepID=UPI001B40116F